MRLQSTSVTPHERPAVTSEFYALMDWVEGSCRSTLILLSQSDFYSLTAALLVLLSSRRAACLALQLLMPLLTQLRTALIKGLAYKSLFFFLLRTVIRPCRSLDDCIKIPGLLRKNKPNTRSQIRVKKILWPLYKPNISQWSEDTM